MIITMLETKILPSRRIAGTRILDIGEFSPRFPLYLAERGAHVTVHDINFTPKTEEVYRQQGITYVQSNLNEIREKPLPVQAPFDVIIWLEVIEHIQDSPIYIFKEFERLLRPGGCLIVGTPNAARLSSRLRLLRGKHPYHHTIKHMYYMAEQYLGHRREYLPSEIDAILQWEGFEIQRRIYYNGTLEDHKKHPWFFRYPYLLVTLLFPRLRWQYIVFAQKKKPRQEPDRCLVKNIKKCC